MRFLKKKGFCVPECDGCILPCQEHEMLLAKSDSHPMRLGENGPETSMSHMHTLSTGRWTCTHFTCVYHISISVIWSPEGKGQQTCWSSTHNPTLPLKEHIANFFNSISFYLSEHDKPVVCSIILVGMIAFGAALLTTNPTADDAITGQAVARKPHFNPKTLNHSLSQTAPWDFKDKVRVLNQESRS